MNKKYDIVKILLILQVFILVGMMITPLKVIALGETVILSTVPYDPKDLFRGDYVNLEYEISRIPKYKIRGDKDDLFNHDKVYVKLKNNDGIHEVDYVSVDKPQGTYLVVDLYHGWHNWEDDDNINVSYNINTFFLEENTGRDLEEKARKGQLLSEVKVYKNKAVLRNITEK